MNQLLKQAREKQGLGIVKLSKLSGISASVIHAIESKEGYDPQIGTLVTLADALNVAVVDLLDTELIRAQRKNIV